MTDSNAHSTPRVSFVVIGKNEQDVISSCLQAIVRCAESLPSWECIFVDSASQDRTAEIAMTYPVTVLRLLPDAFMSPAAGRYIGLLHAQGQYVMFVDADCELDPTFVPNALAEMESNSDIGIVIGTRVYRYGRGLADTTNVRVEHGEPRNQDVTTTGGIALFRKAVLDQTGGHNPFMRSEEERELCLRVRRAGYRIRQIPFTMMIHNSAPGQHKLAFGELWRRFRRGYLEGRGQLLRIAMAHRSFSSDYVIDGTRRVLFFLGWAPLGLLCALLTLLGASPLLLAGWLACSAAFFTMLWARVGCFSEAWFYSVSSYLEAAGLVAGFTKGCRAASEYTRRFEMLKHSGPTDAASVGASKTVQSNGKPLRVFLSCPFASGPVMGGMEKQVALFLKSEAAKRLSIYAFDSSHGQRPEHSTLGRILYAPFYVVYFLFCLLKSRASVVQIRTTGWIVFWKSGVCALISKLCGRKVILSIHTPDFQEFYDSYGWLGKAGIRCTLEGCDRVIALSEAWRVFILNIAPRARIVVLPNGVEEEYFEAAEVNMQRRPNGKTQLFYIGSSSWDRTIEKGFLDLVGALRLNGLADRCQLTAAGTVDPEFERSATDLALGCPGIVATKEKVHFFKQTDIFVQPSHWENMPNVILEAMASGVPIVATSVGAIPEMIDEPKGGFLVPPKDVQALSDAIKRLVDDQPLGRKMGESNYSRAKQYYRLTSTTTRWVDLMYEVAGRP